ncbi:MAG: cyclic nucleotide-binding domain-containing protein, partial [Moorea sp. SIO2B7]|nr:cyclic nucleotide-binding domain-containing protein [Moorena sp. SIO2B7]
MVQALSIISRQQLSDLLCCSFSEKEFKGFLKQIKFLEPKVGLFWETESAEAGVYIIIAGKVRLINSRGDLITTLETGDSFGELTFFPSESFQPYSARASRNLKLCYIPPELLFSLIRKHPQIQDHLYNRAQERNLLLCDGDTVTQTTYKQSTQEFTVKHQEAPPTQKKISQAYFPHPTQRVGHLWQRIIHRYPFFAQQSGSDCGAACLVMVARYWGKRFSVNRLRDISNADRNGASLRGLSTAAESIGFSTRPVKASLDQLGKQILPCIAHWEGNHYIVVYEITRTQVIVADPAIGQKSFTHQEFQTGWTGYALLLQPTALLKEQKDVSTSFWQFFELVKPHSLVLLEVFIASVFIQLFGLITPIFTQLILDRVVVQRSGLTLTAVGLGLLMFSLFRVAMMGLRQYLLDHTANKIDLALIVGFVRHTLLLPLGFFESRFVGDITSRIQENRKIQRFLTGEALSILLDLLTVFIYIGLMFWYSWQMALLTLAIAPPFLLLALIATPFLKRISREVFGAIAKESSYLIETLSGIRTIKSTAVEQTVRWHWEYLLNEKLKKNFSGQVIGNRLQIFSNTIEALATT